MKHVKQYILEQIAAAGLSPERSVQLLTELVRSDADRDRDSDEPALPVPARSDADRDRAGDRDEPALPVPTLPERAADVAIIGIGCRFPGADTPRRFWRNLVARVDSVGPFPQDRLMDVIRSKADLWQRYAEKVQSHEPILGGWLSDVDSFDYEFFGFRKPQAAILAPADRLFLETAWAALDDAGLTRKQLEGSKTGVFLAHTPEVPFEYARLLNADDPEVIPLNNPGATGYRLSYWLDLKGPTMVVNTTCSSSLVAAHVACQSLRAGDCDLAVSGGVSLYLFPFFQDTLDDPMGLLAGDGRCKAFDAAADGLSMGEGVGIVVLKRMEDARRDGDAVYAVIKGSAVNSDGRSNGHTAPDPAAQTSCALEAWRRAGVDPSTITHIETHGAGTQLGDPIEVQALTDAFRAHTDDVGFCSLGSVKTNISHLGDAAGIAGLIKATLSVRHGQLPGLVHLARPNPMIDFSRSAAFAHTDTRSWSPAGVRRAGVSSIGISGTNCHLVLEQAPPPESAVRFAEAALVISATSLGALWRALDEYGELLADAAPEDFSGICHSSYRKEVFEYRAAVVGRSVEELRVKVGRLADLRHLERPPEWMSKQGIYAARVSRGATELYCRLPVPRAGESPGAPDPHRVVIEFLSRSEPALTKLVSEPPPRVHLPAHQLDRYRCWPKHEVEEQIAEEAFFYELGWRATPRPRAGGIASDGVWLVLENGDSDEVGAKLVAALRARGLEVIAVARGPRVARGRDGRYALNPGSAGQYAELVKDLRAAGVDRVAGIVHLWLHRSATDAHDISLSALQDSQEAGVFALFRLVRALEQADLAQAADVVLVTSQAYRVLDGDRTLPHHATAAGFVKVLSQEVPLISSVTIDVALDMGAEQIVDAVLAELETPRPARADAVGYRAGTRYVAGLRRQRLDAPGPSRIRSNGVYVFAGGTGYLGLALGKHFAGRAKVKLVFLSRTALPSPERGRELAAEGLLPGASRAVLDAFAEMRALGSEVIHLPVDVTDGNQLERAFAKIRSRFGRVDGIIGAQKLLAHKPIYELTEAEFQGGIDNRTIAGWLLERQARAADVDFLIFLSSISSIMGTKTAAECCAVNQHLDSLPFAAGASNKARTLNLTLILDDKRDFRGRTPIPPLDFREFLACFDRFLNGGQRLSIVSKFDIEEVRNLRPVLRIPFSPELAHELGLDASEEAAEPVAAPSIAAPRSSADVEDELRGLWAEILGEDLAACDSGFFDAGGTSLTALKLVKHIRQHFGVAFQATDIFAHATLRAMARRIRELQGGTPSSPPLEQILEGVENGAIDVDAAMRSLASS